MNGHVKSALTGILIGLASAGAASAADLPLKVAPVAAPLYNWTGCYVGGNAGAGWTRVDTTRFSQDTIGQSFAFYGRENDSGFLGGGQVGCDFQTTNLVFGVEGQFDFGSVKGTHSIPAFPGFTESNNMKELYLITGRMGYLWTPQLLGYVKVGAAYQTNRNTIFAPGGATWATTQFTDPGIPAGIGFEYMFAPSWSVFAE